MAKQGDEANKPWMIRDMPVETRREVKIFAARTGMTIAEALDFLVNVALYMSLHDEDFPVLGAGDEEKARYFVRPLQLRNQEDFATMMEALAKVLQHKMSGTIEEHKARAEADYKAERELRGRLWREGVLRTDYDSANTDEADDAE